ncbi:MAG: discoidin domain-containing protein, partial [Akkermansiaceae bacterium]|nr:discoidin domain-containing protein [Akkermansiaceae bacterium]
SEIILDCRQSGADEPQRYEVTVSKDGKKWSRPVAKGSGNTPITTIALPLSEAKFVRITQTATKPGRHWSIHDLRVKGKEL